MNTYGRGASRLGSMGIRTEAGEIKMVVGFTLLVLDGNDYYSPSFPRGGLAGTFAVDVSHYDGPTNLTITVQHRDEHDTTFTNAASFNAITGTGHEELDVSGLKQIIRFKYAFTGGNPEDGAHLLMQAPSWRPYE